MTLYWCKKCKQEIPDTRAIEAHDAHFCPECKNPLSYFGREEAAVSPEEHFQTYDESNPINPVEVYTNTFKRYELPPIDTDALGAEDMLQNTPANPDAMLHLAKRYISRLKYQDAEKMLLDLVAHHPDHLDARKTLVELYIQQSDYEKTAGQLEHLVRLHPENEFFQFNLGLTYLELKKDIESLKHLCLAQGLTQDERLKSEIDKVMKWIQSRG